MIPAFKAKELFDKFHYQICNDLGLSESGSTAQAAKNCTILAAEAVKDQCEYAGDENFWDDVIHQISLITN